MTQSGVSAFARLARRFAVSAVLLLASAGALAAQTGKIEGKVRDQAGAPIQSAQVFIVGTAFSALTNAQGYYFINNVPAGTIVLRGAFIGFKKTEIDGIKILAGQTMTQDIQLERATVQLDTLVVVAGANALVPRDEVTTKQRIDGVFVENLPVDRVGQVLQLQPGVVGSTNGTNLSIRGGRDDEAAFYVDGVSTQPGNRGNGDAAAATSSLLVQSAPGVTYGSNSFEEASITTGAASAQYGNAQAGIVSLTSRTGGSKIAGRLAAESDEMFGSTIGMGFNRFEGNLSGPIFKGLTFSVNLAGEGNESVRSGKGRENNPIFVTSGVDTTVDNAGEEVDINSYSVYTGSCDSFSGAKNSDGSASPIASNYGASCHGARLPQSAFSAAALGGNLNFSYGNGSRFRLGTALSQNQGRNFSNGNRLNPGTSGNLQFGFRAQNAVYTLNWTQNLTKSAERALALDVNLSYQTDRFTQSPFADGGPGTGTLGFYFSPIPLQYDMSFLDATFNDSTAGVPTGSVLSRLDCYVRNIKTCAGAIDYTNNDSVSNHKSQFKYRSNPYALANNTFPDGGAANNFLFLYRENRYVANASLDWQLDRYNRIQVGGEFVQYDMTSYAASIDPDFFSDFWSQKPQRYAAFIQDRLDIGDVVVQLGLRYDRFDTRTSRWQGYPRISSNPALDTMPAGTDPAVFFVPDQAFDYLSPRVQVAFPVTERTNFRLSYAQAVQSPDFALVLSGLNTDISTTNSNQVYGQNVDYGKSIIFEFGVQHAFSDDMVLDISAYNRDNLANAAGRLVSAIDPLVDRRRPATPACHQLRLRQHQGHRHPAQPPVRPAVQRHHRVQLYPGGQHRVRSVHVHQLRITGSEHGQRRQPATAAGHRADRTFPAQQPGRRPGADVPEWLERRVDDGRNTAELRRVRDLPVCQRHRVHGVRRSFRQRVDSERWGVHEGRVPRGPQQRAPALVQAVRHALREGVHAGWQPAVGVPRRAEYPGLHQHAHPVRDDQQYHQRRRAPAELHLRQRSLRERSVGERDL